MPTKIENIFFYFWDHFCCSYRIPADYFIPENQYLEPNLQLVTEHHVHMDWMPE